MPPCCGQGRRRAGALHESISVLLIYYLTDGKKRFSDLRRDNPTVSHRILALELRKLEKAGILRRTSHEGYPLRVEYDLTPAGVRLVPLVDAIGDWWEELHPSIGPEDDDRSVAQASRQDARSIAGAGGNR